MSWNYATLSKTAKLYGGPEQYIKMVEHHAMEMGRLAEKAKMPPRLVISFAAGALLVGGVALIMQKSYEKEMMTAHKELNNAKEELLNVILEQEPSQLLEDTAEVDQ